jgi:hypothetical protein
MLDLSVERSVLKIILRMKEICTSENKRRVEKNLKRRVE